MEQIFRRIQRGIFSFAAGTMLSRISGFLRDALTAAVLGASAELALFFIAFRLSHIFRRLFAETPLSAALLPFIEREGAGIYVSIRKKILLWTAMFTLCVEGLLGGISLVLGEEYQAILLMVGVMFPSLLFFVGTGVNGAFLQHRRQLFKMGASSTLCNIVWILALPFAKSAPFPGVVLSIQVLCGSALQFLYTSYAAEKVSSNGVEERKKITSSALRKLLPAFCIALSASAAGQINSALDPLFARASLPEAPAYLWYAIRIYQLPLSLIGISFLSAFFPELTKLASEGEVKEKELLIEKGAYFLALLFLPLTIATWICSEDVISLLYQRGAFSGEDVREAAACLNGYIFGLFPAALTLFFSSDRYADRKYSNVAFSAIGAVLVNLLLNSFFVFGIKLGAASVAYSTSLAAMSQLFFLGKRIHLSTVAFPVAVACGFGVLAKSIHFGLSEYAGGGAFLRVGSIGMLFVLTLYLARGRGRLLTA